MDQCKIIYQSTKLLDLTVQHRSLFELLAEDEARHAGKSLIPTDHLGQEHDLYRAEYNERLIDSMHASEVCKCSITFLYNISICPYPTMPHKGASTQHHNQQVLAKPRHNPSDRDQQVGEKLQQKAKIKS